MVVSTGRVVVSTGTDSTFGGWSFLRVRIECSEGRSLSYVGFLHCIVHFVNEEQCWELKSEQGILGLCM